MSISMSKIASEAIIRQLDGIDPAPRHTRVIRTYKLVEVTNEA